MGKRVLEFFRESGTGCENGGVDVIGDVCDTAVTGGYYIYVRGGDCK